MKSGTKVIGIVGLAGSGKSAVTEFLVKKGWAKVRFGDLTDEELKQRSLPLTEENERTVREELRRTHGMAAYAILNKPRIDENLKMSNVVIDGLYSWEEYKVLRAWYGEKLVVLAVYTSPQPRYERLSKRDTRPLSPEECRRRDLAEIEYTNKGGPIAIADITIVNNGNKEDLEAAVGNVLAGFGDKSKPARVCRRGDRKTGDSR